MKDERIKEIVLSWAHKDRETDTVLFLSSAENAIKQAIAEELEEYVSLNDYEKLEQEKDSLNAGWKKLCDLHLHTLHEQKEELERYREALEFYAKEGNYLLIPVMGGLAISRWMREAEQRLPFRRMTKLGKSCKTCGSSNNKISENKSVCNKCRYRQYQQNRCPLYYNSEYKKAGLVNRMINLAWGTTSQGAQPVPLFGSSRPRLNETASPRRGR